MTDEPVDLPLVDEPTSDNFDALISDALARLPDEFRAQLDSVAIVVDDYPTQEQLVATHSHGLFGIYQGIPRTVYAAHGAPVPSKITLFRRPLEAYNPDPNSLAAAVEDTLFHEIAHHLGISDVRLRELAFARRPPPSGSRAATDAR